METAQHVSFEQLLVHYCARGYLSWFVSSLRGEVGLKRKRRIACMHARAVGACGRACFILLFSLWTCLTYSHSDLPPWALTSSCYCLLVAMSRFYHYFCHYLAFSAMPACHWCHIHAKLCFSLLIKNQFPELFAHCPVYFCTFVAINVQLMIGSPQAELCFLV
jgi:hypothetical protein